MIRTILVKIYYKIFPFQKKIKSLTLAYGDYMSYPNDLGVSHNLEEINNTVGK